MASVKNNKKDITKLRSSAHLKSLRREIGIKQDKNNNTGR